MTIEDVSRETDSASRGGCVQVSEEGPVTVIALDRSTTRHALSPQLLDDLGAAVARAEASGAGALVLTATGRVFSAGGDLQGVAEVLDGAADEAQATAGIARLVDQLHQVIRAIRALAVPVVAAVNGPAIGAGISLAMTADVRVLAPAAAFVPGYLAVGATPDGGASYHLGRAFGGPQALSTFLLNRRIDAQQLLERGLADVVVPEDEDVVVHAVALARTLVGLSPEALAGIRALVDVDDGASFDAHLDTEKHWFLRVSATRQFRDAMSAFSGRPSPAVTPYPT